MKTHTCRCGQHQLPGEIVDRVDDLIIVKVEAPNGVFYELRREGGSIEPGEVHTEDLLSYWQLLPGRNDVIIVVE